MRRPPLLPFLILLAGLGALGGQEVLAGEAVTVCYNYGCLSQDEVLYSEAQLQAVGALLGDAENAVHERALLGVAIGWMLGWAGRQTPIAADRGGNMADDGVYGRMDCIDHATTTTRLLRLLERRGALHFHRVLAPVRRARLLIFEHHAAQVAELPPAGGADGTNGAEGADGGTASGAEEARYAVDSWFFDNGQPAVILPLDRWLAGDGPDIGVAYD